MPADPVPPRETNEPPAPEYIVIFQSAWMNESGYGVNYSWDGRRFADYDDAVSHGFETRGSDDFNLGQVIGDRLVCFSWMQESLPDHLLDAARHLGLDFDLPLPVPSIPEGNPDGPRS